MFKPKQAPNGQAIIYCALCIRFQRVRPKQMVTIFSGTALCPDHLMNYTQYQFLQKEAQDTDYLGVPND